MRTYTLRIVVDTEEDIFRDIEVLENQSFEQLHDAIIHAFDFSGREMASFYMSNDEWEKGLEIGLMDISSFDGDDSAKSMRNTTIGEMLQTKHQKMLYVYDFLRMWIFYVEVIEINNASEEITYPAIVREFGESPLEDSKAIPDLFEGLEDELDEDEFGYGDEDFDGDYDDEFGDDNPFGEFDDSYDY